MLSRNYDNKVAIRCSMQIVKGYLSETPAWWSVWERQRLQRCTRATTLHLITFKKRIGQYLLKEINIKVQNEEVSGQKMTLDPAGKWYEEVMKDFQSGNVRAR